MQLNGRTAIVTGAGAGLGRAHALRLARHGARVVVNDLGEAADRVADEIVAAGGEALAVRCSVTEEDAVAAMVEAALARFGTVDILVNNAGILRDASFAKISVAAFREVVEVHLMGAVVCTKAVWEPMRAQGRGRIVFTTSSSGLFGNFGQANYGAAKMALVGLMQTLSIEGAKYGIRVNCLAPTAATAMTEALLPHAAKALLTPEAVGPGLLALVGDDAPSRAILCGGAGHFERAHVTLTRGAYIGHDDEAADRLLARWDEIGDRAGDDVPEAGGAQVAREMTGASPAGTPGDDIERGESMSDLNGTYDLVANTPMGNQKLTLTVAVQGDAFTGTASGAMGSSDVSGTVDGNRLSWKQAITVPMPLTLDCTATVDGDELKGSIDTGAFGSFPLTGTRTG